MAGVTGSGTCLRALQQAPAQCLRRSLAGDLQSCNACYPQANGFEGTTAYVWPQWTAPLSLTEVTLLRQRPVGSLNRLPGVETVWSSQITSVGKYGFLRPGART